MMRKNGRFFIKWLRLIGLLTGCFGLGVNALRADSRIVVLRPTNFDPTAVCGFDIRSEVWLCAEGANDTCIWEVTDGVGSFGYPVTLYGNKYGDTIPFNFAEMPVDGTITLKMGKNSEAVVGKLELKQIKKAEPASDITWAPPVCQNIPIRFEMPVDEDYQTKYAPGSLHLRWTPLQEKQDIADGESEFVDVSADGDFIWMHTFKGANFKDGKVVVTPYTCDGKNGSKYRTNVKEKELKPFIVQGLYKDVGIVTLKKKEGGELPDDMDHWEVDGSEDSPNTTICRNYGNDLWNGYIENNGYVSLGFGDYQAWLDAEDKTLLPEYYYTYDWSFAEDEFEYATEKMDNQADWGFGKGKSRIMLRVLAGKTNVHTVKLTVRCDTCIARGGYPADFTYTAEIKLHRQDSIASFKDEVHPIEYNLEAQGNVCAGEEVVLRLSMDEMSEKYFDELSNAKHYTIDPKKPDGSSANWEQLPQDPGDKEIHKFKTTRTSWNGRTGDTIYVSVYPSNDCFWNLKKVGANGKMFKVFVKNPPLPPVLRDPITGKGIAPQYTETRWEDLVEEGLGEGDQKAAERVFVCNYTTWQDHTWLSGTQQFGLQVKGDSIFEPGGGDAFRLVDYDDVFIRDIKIDYSFEKGRKPDNPDVKKDSSWITMSVRAGAREYFEGVQDVKVGFYAYNNCGRGDTGIYYIKIIDTLTTKDLLSNTRAVGWDTLCEGMALDLYSTSRESYFTSADIGEDIDRRPEVVSDRVDYEWVAPAGWTFAESTPNTDKRVQLRVGPTSGPVRLRLGNRCGYGKYLDSNVFVHPFVRVHVVGDTTPCRGDTLTYRFKKADLAEDYQITWPGNDWVQTDWQSGIDSMFYTVRVGDHEDEPIYVVGQKTKVPGLKPISEAEEEDGCNFRFDNYADHNRDSLAVKVKHYTAQPVIDGRFPEMVGGRPDTLCARNLYTFQVKKGSEDDDSVFFKWFFPDDPAGWSASYPDKDHDTVDFTVPLISGQKRVTIRVASSRYDCAATNIGDTLDIAVWLTDTLAVEGDFLDAHPDNKTGGGRIDRTPCEGDTVYYTLNKKLQHPEAYYASFDVRPLEADYTDADWNALAASDWEILSAAPYHDTLKMVVGRDPMRLRAAMVSHCDTSSFKEDTIRPISKVIDAGLIEVDRPDENLCEYEAVSFTFEPVSHATHYVFHYPWGDRTDTVRVADSVADRAAGRLTDDGFYKISFADTFAYDKGKVYLEAYNVCGVRPDNDELEIASVLRRPAVPVLTRTDFTDFVYDAAHVIGRDTVMDSICLREPKVLEAGPNDVAAAGAAGWRFHYAWDLTAEDASVTAFEAYESAGWTAGAGINASDSLWTLTKEADGLDVNYLWLTSRHETCKRFGDTLTVALRPTDTTALPGEDRIWNYLYDKANDGKHIQTKPCATDGGLVAYYLDLSALDATGESYYFRWRRDSTEAFANVYDPVTKRLAGGNFTLNNVPADADGDGEPDWATLDTLRMTLPTVRDTLEIQVVVRNRCAEAHLPGLTVQTDDAIGLTDVYAVVQVSDYICNEEKLTYKAISITGADTIDGVPKAGQYVWYTPWHEKPDTTDHFVMSFDTTVYKPGKIFVVPNNGCGDGHRSDSIEIAEADILSPPLRVQPVPSPDFAAGYDPAAGVEAELVTDSLCLRSDFSMAVKAELSPAGTAGAPQDALSYGWFTAYGKAEALTIPDAADSTRAVVNVPDFADSAYIIYVAARRSVCQRFGDSLRIDLFPMDTIRFINDPVEDSLPYDRFTVLTRDAMQDGWPTATVDEVSLSPCVGSMHTYGIKPDFHWSLTTAEAETVAPVAARKADRRAKRASKAAVDENRLHFSWNGGKTAATDGILDGTTTWKSLQADRLPYVLDVEVGAAGDPLHLSVHARNICGPSVSKPLTIEPQALINVAEKPVFKPLAPLCEDDTIRVEVEPVASATGYVWTASFRGGRTDTTVEPEIAYPDYAVADGTVTVYGFNACGDGMLSDPLEIKPLLRIPERPTAKWFDNLKTSAAGDTVYDTLCLHGANLLWVAAAFSDEAVDETVFYDWKMLPAYADYAILTAPSGTLDDGPDSVYIEPKRGMAVGEDLHLMVAARRASCRRWSDTLYIALHLTDTVSVGSLGRLFWYDPDLDDRTPITLELPYCPGREVRIGVENEHAAPAYRWRFPDDTWRFADDVADTTAAVVKVIVGETAGAIRVSPMTDPDNRRCAYFADGNALTSTLVELVPALPPREFVTEGANAFNETPCAGTAVVYELRPPVPSEIGSIEHYRWVFPQGWRVYAADGTLTESNRQEPGGLTCRVLPDSSSGTVSAYVVSKCGANSQSVSRPVERAARPIDTARLELIADETVCKDSTLQIEVKPLNGWTSGTGYDLSVAYLGSDAAVVNPENPLAFDFPNAPDSSLVYVAWHSGDSVRLTFTPRHTAGCANAVPVVYALKADTIPAIDGRIIGPARVCMEAEVAFKAEADLAEGISVTYRWEVPDEAGWEILQGGDSAEVLIKVGRYEETDELTKTIRCYPRALCGTAAPFEYTVTINPPAPFNGTLQAFYHADHTELTPDDRPCIGSDLVFELTHADAPARVRYVWETPAGWARTTTGTAIDSASRAVFTASKAGADTMRVRFIELDNPLSCGLSQALGYAVFIRDSAPKARLTRPPYPCRTRTEVAFVVMPDGEIDKAGWTWPAEYDPTAAVTTDEGSRIEDNRLTLGELTPGGGFTTEFGLVIRTTNGCGSRDTTIRVRPVDAIPALPAGILHVSHYCPGDSAYAYADKLDAYVETGTEYKWLTDALLTPLQDSLVRENDDPAGAEKVAWMRFAAAASAADTAEIRFYAQNDCNATDTALIRTAAYTYAILAHPERDTAVYGQSGVGLSVVATQYGTPADYTYVWQPADRVSLSDPEAPDAPETTFATKGLYNRHEYFQVTSTERIDTATPFYFGRSACQAYDTVAIFVDSTFAMALEDVDTACINAPFELSAQAYGGNAARYYFDWYRLTADSLYEPLADAGHGEVLTLTIDAPLIRLMVIGRDTTLVYAETPDVPENPEAPTNPDDADEPEPGAPDIPESPDAPENPDNPTNPDVPEQPSDEPLYVFTQVDTQYIELQAFEVNGRWILPGRDEIQVPFGTKVRLSAEATGGSRQYVYEWTPAEMLERHDSTAASVSTLRLYEDCDAALTIRDAVTGCRDSLHVRIGLSDEIGDIPNAFSPNGDGINDIFMKGTDLVIYDRFGQELFRSVQQEGWDGTFKGATVKPGDYLFVVTIRKNGQEYVKKGTVTVFIK